MSYRRPNGAHKNKRKVARWLLLGTGVVSLLLAACVLWQLRFHFFHPRVHIDRSLYPIVGIDVSNHNGAVNFEKVRNDGISFVILKASEGKGYKDPAFSRFYNSARLAGLKVGAYHFFRKNKGGVEQAHNFHNALGSKRLDLPPVIDVEDWSNDHFVDDATTLQRLDDMVRQLKRLGHRKVMIYTNGDGFKKYVTRTFTHDYLWICSFNDPATIKSYRHTMQQFSHWGKVSGVEGDVDMNVFNGSRSQWNKWLAEVAPIIK